MQLKVYKVWYTKNNSAKVKARSINGAREQAWKMLGSFKYGWTKKDFMANSSVDRLIN